MYSVECTVLFDQCMQPIRCMQSHGTESQSCFKHPRARRAIARAAIVSRGDAHSSAAPTRTYVGETHEDVRQWVEGCPGSDVRIRFVRKVTGGQACDRDWRKHRHRNGDSSRAGVERLTRLDVRSQRGEGRCCNREQSAQDAHQTLPPVWSVLLVPERCAVSRMLLFSVSACPETHRRHAKEYRRKG